MMMILCVDDDTDDSDDQVATFLIFLAAIALQYSRGSSFYTRNRIEWNAHVAELYMESPRAFR